MKYYFKLENSQPIKIISTVLNLDKFNSYQKLTTAQEQYYLANQNASVIEVWNVNDNTTSQTQEQETPTQIENNGNYYDGNYYYFKSKNGSTIIKVTTYKIPTNINTSYTEFTSQQVQFYLANPNASVEEVRNCQLNEVVEVDDNLQYVKADAINELKNLYTSSVKVSDIDFAAAVTDFLKQNNSLTLASVPDLMDNTYSRSVIAEFATSYLASKALFDGGKAAIESAASEDAVQNALNDYRARFAAL